MTQYPLTNGVNLWCEKMVNDPTNTLLRLVSDQDSPKLGEYELMWTVDRLKIIYAD